MASTLFGATLYKKGMSESDMTYDVLGKDSEVFAVGDPVTIASGVLKVVAAATDPIVGVAAKKQTMPATNDATYEPLVPADDESVFLMGCNAALTDNETDPGTFYGLTGATGAVQVNVAGGVTTTTSRQVVIVKVDPNNVGGTEGPQECLVKFFRTPSLNI